MDVFLSYPSSKRRLAQVLRKRLEEEGLRVLQVTCEDPASWRSEAERAARKVQLFLILIDPARPPSHAQQSEWQVALEAAWEDPGKRLIPVLPRGAEVPAFVRSASGGQHVLALWLDDERDLTAVARAARALGDPHGQDVRRSRGLPTEQDTNVMREGGAAWDEDRPVGNPPKAGYAVSLDSPDAGSGGSGGTKSGYPVSGYPATVDERDREERRKRLAEIRRFANSLKE
jgi:hypothetical protein